MLGLVDHTDARAEFPIDAPPRRLSGSVLFDALIKNLIVQPCQNLPMLAYAGQILHIEPGNVHDVDIIRNPPPW